VGAALGYLLGSVALPAFAAVVGASSSTPVARVGYVLREQPQARIVDGNPAGQAAVFLYLMSGHPQLP